MSRLDGAVTIVTGGAGGLGTALSQELVGRGSRIILAENRDATEAVQNLRDAGAEAEWFEVDVSDYAQMEKLREFAISTYGGVNVLINNAVYAEGAGGMIPETDPAGVRRVFEVNVIGYYNGIRAFAEDLRNAAADGRPAHLMCVGSEHSFGVPPHCAPASPYTVSKYTMLAFTDVARRDFAGTDVGVTLLAPGWIYTDLVKHYAEATPEFAEQVLPYAQTPEFVAREAIDGMLRNDYIIFPNPRSAPFAIEHADAVLAALRAAAAQDLPDEVWIQP